jgi:hypothetical protein
MKKKVYILGAGCSARYGCPVATDVVPEFKSYGKSLGDNQVQLKQCVEETVELMQKENVETIDDLTMRIESVVNYILNTLS